MSQHVRSFHALAVPSSPPMHVAGLNGQPSQVQDAVSFASDLLSALSSIKLEGPLKLELAIGVHTCAAQGVVVGVECPLMYIMGNLASEAAVLEAICPPGCILVSSNVHGILGKETSLVGKPHHCRGSLG